MKKTPSRQSGPLWILVVMLLASGLIRSLAAGEDLIPLLKTASGEYRNVKIFNRTESHLSFSHEKGTAVIKISDVEIESMSAVEQTNANSIETANQTPGAVVMMSAQSNPAPDSAWVAQVKEVLSKLESEAAPLEISRNQMWGIVGAFVFLWWFYSLCASLICKKAGEPSGLLVWLPVFQMIPLFRAARMSGWWFVAMFIPLLNLIGQLLWCVKISQARGKGFFTAVMLILPVTNILAFVYLAFSNGHLKEKDAFALVPPPHALALD